MSPPETEPEAQTPPEAAAKTEAGALIASAAWTPTLAEFQAFAALSGDANPIHLDAAFAATHPFGRPVSHGMLIHARLWALGQRCGLSPRLTARITFPSPAYAGERLRLSLARVTGGILAQAARADGTLVCDATWQDEAR